MFFIVDDDPNLRDNQKDNIFLRINMNFKELSDNLGMEEDEYMELIELFFETSISDLKKLQVAVEEANAKKVADIAHSFKGAALNLGLTELFEIAKQLEMTVCDGQLKRTAKVALVLKEKLDTIAGFIK